MAYSIRCQGRGGPAARRWRWRPPALRLDRAGDLPKAGSGGGLLAAPPGRAWRLTGVPRRSLRGPPPAGRGPV